MSNLGRCKFQIRRLEIIVKAWKRFQAKAGALAAMDQWWRAFRQTRLNSTDSPCVCWFVAANIYIYNHGLIIIMRAWMNCCYLQITAWCSWKSVIALGGKYTRSSNSQLFSLQTWQLRRWPRCLRIESKAIAKSVAMPSPTKPQRFFRFGSLY